MYRIDHIEKKIFKTFNKYLAEKGYSSKNNTQFYKESDKVMDKISFRVVSIYNDFGVICYFIRSYNAIEVDLNKLVKMFNLREMDYTIWITRTSLNPSLEDTKGHSILKGGGIYLKTSDIDNEIEKFKNTFIYEYENIICPFLKQTENIHWMDEVLNADPMDFDEPCKYFPDTGLIFKKLIVAKLANNSKYEDMYKTYSNLYENFLKENNDEESKNQYQVLQIVYDRLKDVKPLDNPILV